MQFTNAYQTTWGERQLTPERKLLIVAVDHGLSLANIEGLEQPFETADLLVANPEVDGVIASAGLLRHAQRSGIDMSRIIRLVTVDYVGFGGESDNPALTIRRAIVDPELAVEAHPHAFKMFLNIYEDPNLLLDNIRDVERYISAGQRYGIATLVEVVFYGNRQFAEASTQLNVFIRGCRLAMELGADAIKVPMIADTQGLAETITTMHVPTFILGGSRHRTREALVEELRKVAKLPVCGIMFGRNVWQSGNIPATIADIAAVIHSPATHPGPIGER